MCTNCGSDEVELCSCQDGKHSWGVTSASTLVTSASFVLTMSTVGQYGAGWAAVNEHVFIQGFGYYKVVSSTSSTISLTEPASPFVGGAAFAANTVDFQSQAISGNYTIASGTKVTPAGLKGTTGTTGSSGASLLAIDYNQAGVNNPTSQTSFSVVQESVTVGSGSRLSATGDTLKISGQFFYNDTTSYSGSNVEGKIVFEQTSTGVTVILGQIYLTSKNPAGTLDIVVSRDSSGNTISSIVKRSPLAVTVGYSYANETTLSDPAISFVSYGANAQGGGLIDFTANFTIEFWGKVNNGADEIKIGFYSVEFLKKL